MSHLCAIPDCPTPAKDGQLMCWPHWRRVPRALNHAVFDTYRTLRQDPAAYRQARDAAVAAVVAKERQHVYFVCPGTNPRCIEGRCVYCEGGLSYCTVCAQGEGELEPTCPGPKMEYDL